jgi:hypothetical protein
VEVGTIEGIAIFVVAVVLLGDAEGIIVGMIDEGFVVGIIVGCVGDILGLLSLGLKLGK